MQFKHNKATQILSGKNIPLNASTGSEQAIQFRNDLIIRK